MIFLSLPPPRPQGSTDGGRGLQPPTNYLGRGAGGGRGSPQILSTAKMSPKIDCMAKNVLFFLPSASKKCYEIRIFVCGA